MRILGQIADKANLLGVAAKKKLVEDEKTKLNEAIKSFCNDALAFLAALPEVETEKGQRQAVTIQQAHRLKMRADYKDIWQHSQPTKKSGWKCHRLANLPSFTNWLYQE